MNPEPGKNYAIPGRHAAGDAPVNTFEYEHLQARSAILAQILTIWMGAPIGAPTPMDGASAELTEWCRQARDTLEAVRDA